MPGPENIFRSRFSNGVTVLIRENPYSQAAVLAGSMPCGSYLDPADKTGLNEFVAGCLTSGTQAHDFYRFHSLLEESAASLSIHSGPRSLTFNGSCLSEDLPMLMSLLKECLDQPVFPPEHIEIFRQRALSAYELSRQDPESMSSERLDALLFGEHPYGRPEFGSEEIIRSISRQDMLDFHRNYFGPQGLTLTIVGGFRAEEIRDECEKIFAGWNKQQAAVDTAAYFPGLPLPDKKIIEHIEIPEKSEMSLVIGTMGPSRTDPDHLAAAIGNSILGEFGMMGRIGQIVREENGLAYSASSSLTALTYGGCWEVDAGINPANAEKAADLICRELRRFTAEKVSREELEDVKSCYIGGLPLSLESNSGVAGLLMAIETHHLGLDYLIRLPDKVREITAEQILETAKRWIDPDRMIQITAGTSA